MSAEASTIPKGQQGLKRGGTVPQDHKRRRAMRQNADRRYALWADMNYEAQVELRNLLKDPSPQIRLGAIKEIFDRTDGKPRQQAQLEIKGDITALYLDALRACNAKASDMIDVTPSAANG